MPINFKTSRNDRSIKTLAGVRVFPVSTIVITDTSVASGVALYDTASMLDWMAVLFEMMLISFLKIKGYHKLCGHSFEPTRRQCSLLFEILTRWTGGKCTLPHRSLLCESTSLRPHDSVWGIIPTEDKLDSMKCFTHNNETIILRSGGDIHPLSPTLR